MARVERIAAKVMILNNQHLGMVVQWEDSFYKSNRGHTSRQVFGQSNRSTRTPFPPTATANPLASSGYPSCERCSSTAVFAAVKVSAIAIVGEDVPWDDICRLTSDHTPLWSDP